MSDCYRGTVVSAHIGQDGSKELSPFVISIIRSPEGVITLCI